MHMCTVINKQYTTVNKQCMLYALQVGNSTTTAAEKSKLRSEVIKQVKDLFDLKEMGAITEKEYEEKKKNLLEYL